MATRPRVDATSLAKKQPGNIFFFCGDFRRCQVSFCLRGTRESCTGVPRGSDYSPQKAVKIAVIIQKLPPCILPLSLCAGLCLCGADWAAQSFACVVFESCLLAFVATVSPYHCSISCRLEVNCSAFMGISVFSLPVDTNTIRTLGFRGRKVPVNYISSPWSSLSTCRVQRNQHQEGLGPVCSGRCSREQCFNEWCFKWEKCCINNMTLKHSQPNTFCFKSSGRHFVELFTDPGSEVMLGPHAHTCLYLWHEFVLYYC